MALNYGCSIRAENGFRCFCLSDVCVLNVGIDCSGIEQMSCRFVA